MQYHSYLQIGQGVTNMYQQVSHRCVPLLPNKIIIFQIQPTRVSNQKDQFIVADWRDDFHMSYWFAGCIL